MWVLLNVMALTGKAIGLTDQEIVYIANRATKEILYGKEGSAVSGVRQEDLPVINFSGQGGDGDEALPVLPVPGVSQEKGEPVQD